MRLSRDGIHISEYVALTMFLRDKTVQEFYGNDEFGFGINSNVGGNSNAVAVVNGSNARQVGPIVQSLMGILDGQKIQIETIPNGNPLPNLLGKISTYTNTSRLHNLIDLAMFHYGEEAYDLVESQGINFSEKGEIQYSRAYLH